jgi:hypothetical protein
MLTCSTIGCDKVVFIESSQNNFKNELISMILHTQNIESTWYRRSKKKNQLVQKTYYKTGRVEDTQEEQLGMFK